MEDIQQYKLRIRNKLIELLRPQIEDEEFFCREFVFHKSIIEYPDLESLIDAEMDQYSEERTLKIASIFDDLSRPVLSERNIHTSFKFHFNTSLCLYERAVKHDSAKGYYRASQLYATGGGGIAKDSEKAHAYLIKSKELGYVPNEYHIDIQSLAKALVPKEEPQKQSFWDRIFRR